MLLLHLELRSFCLFYLTVQRFRGLLHELVSNNNVEWEVPVAARVLESFHGGLEGVRTRRGEIYVREIDLVDCVLGLFCRQGSGTDFVQKLLLELREVDFYLLRLVPLLERFNR